MAKLFTIFVIVALLVCSTTLTNAARPLTPSNHQDNEAENVKVQENESCKGVNEEECLMRRTLVAHTDYIYTQNQNP